ncbi:TPA: hypothetical protein ACGUO9_003307 [Vibrio vulnificus]
MTAEIAVFNKSAVALAADSAVTISGGGSSKIYNGAEKLFALTKHHPVGIMVYGTGSLCSIPWELIIKEYRRKLGSSSFDTLDAYAEDFWTFLSGSTRLIHNDFRRTYLEQIYFQAFETLATRVEEKVSQLFQRDPSYQLSFVESLSIYLVTANEMIVELEQCDYFYGFDDQDIANELPHASTYVDQYLSERIPTVQFEQIHRDTFSRMLSMISCRQNLLGVNTGVVIAGYGNEEYFPVVLAFNVQGFVGDKLRLAPNLSKSSAAGQSGMQAYAQEDEVYTFTNGINPNLLQCFNDSFQNTLRSILKKHTELIDSLGLDTATKDRINQAFLNHMNATWDANVQMADSVMVREHLDKVTQMIEFLPKDELGYMAESLVNMTAFKRKVSNDSETVGGPIDVAIISKGDGFIWVKRKHYFSKELNNHYFNEFLKGDNHD